jgi:chemotaxis-related protein WspB
MKVLIFQIGPDRYGLRLRDVGRVLPAVQLKQLPLAPGYVAGLMDFHGQPLPVIDLSRLAGITPDQIWFDTRIILLNYEVGGGDTRLLGLLAEHVIGIDTVAASALGDSGVESAPFLGQVAGAANGMLQLIEVDQLLPPDVRALLFQPKEMAA